MDLLVGGSTLNLRLKHAAQSQHCLFSKFQHAPGALLWGERHLGFHCPLAVGGLYRDSSGEKKVLSQCICGLHINKYIPLSFDFRFDFDFVRRVYINDSEY
jgi:hypothetical protein